MSIDLIKSYLIGLGFEIDKGSLNAATVGMDNVQRKVADFNESSSKGFSETGTSLKDLFSLLKSTKTLGKLFPSLYEPLDEIIEDMKLIKSIYDKLSGNKKDKTISKKTQSVEKKDISRDNKNLGYELVKEKVMSAPKVKSASSTKDSINAIGGVSKDAALKVGELKKGLTSLVSKGGTSIKALAASSVATFAVVAAAVVAVVAVVTALIVAIKKLSSYLNELADRDIEYEKLSRMLWTTKENAKEVSQALDVLGASMEDLWLSPTLLKQFNQLKKDSSELRIPKEFQDNLKIVQDIGLEFKRLKQLMSMLFEWIGHYILEYLSGPLAEVKNGMGDLNSWLIQNIPKIAEVIGTFIGVFLRLLLILGKVIVLLWKIGSPIWKFIKLIGKANKAIDKLPEGVKKAVKIIVSTLSFIYAPILLIIALIDDLLTFMRGGESVIGDVIDYLSGKIEETIDKLLGKFKFLRKFFKEDSSLDTDEWSSYYERASESLEKLRNKAKEVFGDIKEWSTNILEKGKDFFKSSAEKVITFERDYGVGSGGSVSKSYLTNNTQHSTRTENNNEVNNQNTINVYSNDAIQTGNVISKRLTGITSRNLQGVVE